MPNRKLISNEIPKHIHKREDEMLISEFSSKVD
jgi:hypothetical protein